MCLSVFGGEMRKLSAFLAFFGFLFFTSCESTRVYMQSTLRTYEDDVLVAESYKEVLQHQSEKGKLQKRKDKLITLVKSYDLSNAGFIVVDTTTKTTTEGNVSKSETVLTLHSFVAEKKESSKEANAQITYTLVETKYFEKTTTQDGKSSVKKEYKTDTKGKKTFFVDKKGSIVAKSNNGGSSVKITGDVFSSEDEAFFENILSLTLPLVTAPEGLAAVSEDSGKVFRTEEKRETITVVSRPNGEYIFYQIAGKPFVIAGCTAWNLLKCAGYAIINFAGGYQLTTGGSGWGDGGNSYWLMPSFKTAKEKFEDAREDNRIRYYPEYHIPFTNNEITVRVIEQEASESFFAEEKARVKSDTTRHFSNKLAVSRSASADAKYTAGVVGVIGTGATIPVSVLTWIGGAAIGVMGQMSN